MERLSTLDLSNLRVEDCGLPMHVAALAILDGAAPGPGWTWTRCGRSSGSGCTWHPGCGRCCIGPGAAWAAGLGGFCRV